MSPSLAALYDTVVADYYDYYVPHRDVDFYLTEARAVGGPVLELGCGTGRILLPIARAGLDVTGLDISERMLTRFRGKLESEPPEVQNRVSLVHGDMAAFNLGRQFRLVTIPYRPFQHLLEVKHQIDCLRCAARHLVPGGRLMLDFFQTDPARMHDPKFCAPSESHGEASLPGGSKLTVTDRTVAFHLAKQRNDVEMYYNVTHPDGRTERHTFAFTTRYFFRFEVEHLLARCGFRIAALYGDFDRSPLIDNSPDMIFVAIQESLPIRTR